MFKSLLIIFLFFTYLNLSAQNDSIYIGFDYNHDEAQNCSFRYCMNDKYKISKRDSVWFDLPGFKFIQPIDQQFCKILTVSAFRHEMAKYPIYSYEPRALFEITRKQVDSIRNLEKNYIKEREKIYALLPEVNDQKIDSLVRHEIKLNENGSYSGQEIIDAVFLHEKQLRYFMNGNYFDVYPNRLDSLNSAYKKIREKEIQPKVDEFMQPYYISQTEITNFEYKEFVNWVRDSIAFHALYDSLPNNEAIALLNVSKREKKNLNPNLKNDNLMKYGFNYKLTIYNDPKYIPYLTFMYYPQPERFYKRREIDTRKLIYKKFDGSFIAIYPDTCQFAIDDEYTFHNPLTSMYFWHPAYDKYPVQSISYDQILAFCEWKQNVMNQIYKLYGLEISYSLPSLFEYEMTNKFNQPHYGKHHLENFSNVNYFSNYRKFGSGINYLFKTYYLNSYKNSNNDNDYNKIENESCTLDEVYWLKLKQWIKSNLNDGQIFFLNGNISEYSSTPVTKEMIDYYQIDKTDIDIHHLENYCLVLGSNARMDVIDKTGNQNNVLFYKQIIRKDKPGAYFGFRPVIRVKNINPNLNKKYLVSH